MKLKVFTIKLNDGKFIVNDYYNKELPSAKYENKAHAIELCRMRLGKSIHDELHQVKVPFTNMWIVW